MRRRVKEITKGLTDDKAQVRAVYDSQDDLAERDPDPVTQAAIRESARVRRVDPREREEASYREPPPSYPAHAERGHDEDDLWGRREGSGPRSRPVPPDPSRSYAAPVPAYDDDSHSQPWGQPPPPLAAPVTIGYPAHPAPPQGNYASYEAQLAVPASPRLPEEVRGAPAFVVGVQPIRTATPDAWGTPQAQGQAYHPQGYLPSPMQAMQAMQAMQQAIPAGYGVAANQVHPYVVQGRAAQPTPWPSQQPLPPPQQPYFPSHHPSSQPQAYQQQRHAPPMPSSRPVASVAQPVGAQLAPVPSSAARVGRFAWFVAGAAFGITFAFFATGFFSGSGSAKAAKEDPSAAVPTMTQQAPQAQAPQAQPPQVQPQAFAQPPVAFAQPPVVGLPQAATSPTNLPNAQRPQPVAQRPAPPPRAPRPAPAPRRPSRSADDGPAAPAPAAAPAGGGDLNDLLGAGLKP